MILEELQLYFSYPFVRNALVVGVLISLCSSLFGTTLVLKRLSFIGDGLSHVAFSAVAVATVVGTANDMFITLPVTVFAAVMLLRAGRHAKLKGDAAIAVLSVSSLGIGYLLMNLFAKSSNLSGDVCSTLFGSVAILTLTQTEVILSMVLAALVILVFLFSYNRIFSVTFDEEFAAATGGRAETYNLFIAVIVAIIIVLAMNLVGTLLMSALIIFPSLSAMRVFKSFRSVTICAAVLSVLCSVTGLLVSILAGTPVGATIVAADLAVFIIFCMLGMYCNKAVS